MNYRQREQNYEVINRQHYTKDRDRSRPKHSSNSQSPTKKYNNRPTKIPFEGGVEPRKEEHSPITLNRNDELRKSTKAAPGKFRKKWEQRPNKSTEQSLTEYAKQVDGKDIEI